MAVKLNHAIGTRATSGLQPSFYLLHHHAT